METVIQPEEEQRNQSLGPLYDLASSLVERVGRSAEERVDWLMAQTSESFGQLLTDINATARGISPEGHTFDGGGIHAGAVEGSFPPDQEDKLVLLDELVQKSQAHAQWRLGEGASAQTILTELAMAMPTVINKLHLFNQGNGRTSRMLRMILRDADQLTPDKIDALVNKKGYGRYDTIPGLPVERAVMRAVLADNGTAEGYSVQDDVAHEDYMEDVYGDDDLPIAPERLAGIDDRITDGYAKDSFNFYETIRLMAKGRGLSGQISLGAMLEQTKTPGGLDAFLQTYKGVRKQRAELLMAGLIGTREIPLVDNVERTVQRWVNRGRQRLGLSLVDPNQIKTVRQLQLAYMETFSPQRVGVA